MIIMFDYWRCQQVIRHASKTFYAAFSRLPTRQEQQAVYAIYALFRIADDCVDEHPHSNRLARFEQEFDAAIMKRQYVPHFMWCALQDTWSKYPTSTDPYRLMIEGQKTDLNPTPYETLDNLIIYCERVASSVGWMLNPILAPLHHDQL